jgi:hypothetical protein
MYAGFSGATCVYTCCIVGEVCICGKIIFLDLGFAKGDFMSTQGNGKMPYVQDCRGEANLNITDAP